MQIYTIKIESIWHGGKVFVLWKTWVCILTHYWQGLFPQLSTFCQKCFGKFHAGDFSLDGCFFLPCKQPCLQDLGPIIALYMQGRITSLFSSSWHENLEIRMIEIWNEALKNCVLIKFPSKIPKCTASPPPIWMCMVKAL